MNFFQKLFILLTKSPKYAKTTGMNSMGVPVKELEETTTTTVRDMSQSLYRQKHQNYHPEQSDYSLLISSPLFLKKKKNITANDRF